MNRSLASGSLNLKKVLTKKFWREWANPYLQVLKLIKIEF